MASVDPDALYALAPEDFTAARDAAAKQAKADGDAAGAKALTALRRPSVSAWVVNRLASDQRPLLDRLLALGPALAQAQAGGRADELRALGRQRRELVEVVTAAAAGGVDRTLTSTVRDEVAATLEAALADPASAQAVRSGRLVRALSYAGFGGVDLAGAVAEAAGVAAPAGRREQTRPPGAEPPTGEGAGQSEQAGVPGAARSTGNPGERPKQAKGPGVERPTGTGSGRSAQAADRKAKQAAQRAVREAEGAAHDAAGRLDDAVRAAVLAERASTEAAAAVADADRAVAHARAALAAAEQDREAAAREEQRAEQEAQAAVEAVGAAQAAAEAARAALDRLRRS